jgi:DNA modification methylase/endonuclease YncB( thermonuclease family)
MTMAVWATIYIADSRNMAEIADESVHLIVTSPPYWHLKDYGTQGQIGYGQTLHEYLLDLSRVWRECWRVLKAGRRLCINIGDQFARSIVYGRYKVIPIHAEIIAQCETIGFDYMGAIIWRKKTTVRTTGGAVVMGSFPYPPNGIVELDYEFILLFKKPERDAGRGARDAVPQVAKEASKLTRDEWKEFFSGHWEFAGERQALHEAMFPEELPYRLIRMFSFVGETVLDPFLGSGTTVKVALGLGRNAIGYEIQPAFVPIIRQKLGTLFCPEATILHRQRPLPPVDPPPNYRPSVQDAKPLSDPKQVEGQIKATVAQTHKITEVVDATTLRTDTGLTVRLTGIIVPPERQQTAIAYLRRYVLGKRVFLRCESPQADGTVAAYLYLTNRLFVNRKMIEMGIADADPTTQHPLREKFLKAAVNRPSTP